MLFNEKFKDLMKISTKPFNKFDKDNLTLARQGWLFLRSLLKRLKLLLLSVDRRVDGAISFFFRHFGKTKFMISMSKKAQVLGLERLFEKGPKAFCYFFLFYLVRDTILYIIIPIYFAKWTGQ